jgi:glucose/arabinose dehydrogenase
MRQQALRSFAAIGLVFLWGCGDDTGTGDTAVRADIACDPDDGGIVLATGFCALVFHDGVRDARHLAVAPNGDVYVARARRPQGSTGPGLVALRDTTGDGRADVMEEFGDTRGTGIAVLDGHLYFSTDTSVARYRLPDDESLVPTGAPEWIVHGFPAQTSHAAKALALDGSGSLWVGVGAPSNNCGGETDRRPGAVGLDPCPELEWQGGVWRFDADRLDQHQRDGERWASGIRNIVALDFDREAGRLWAVQHGRDQMNVVSDDFTAEENALRPAEELLLLERGSAFSWPYCFFDLETGGFVVAPEYGGTGTETDRCAEYPQPVAVFGGHWAPNDMLFYTGDQFPARYRDGVFIAFHGSWNRAPLPQEGYNVVFQPLNGAISGGDYEVFADGFAGTETIASVGEAEFRPMGLAQGPDGSLYISDSVEGRIWRIVHSGP